MTNREVITAETTTAKSSNLPNFIIIGAMRAGTTSLHRYLSTHPDIWMSQEKETNFFIKGKNWERGLEWYKSFFKTTKPFRGEASPNYTKCEIFPDVPELMHSIIPDVKLIFVSRNPVSRAISHYRFMKNLNPLLEEEETYENIIDASSYHKQLSCFLNVFPKKQILVISFEELTNNPEATLKSVTDFIGARNIWSNVQPVKSNSSQELEGLPRWLIVIVRINVIRRIRLMIPQNIIDKIRSILTRNPKKKSQPITISSSFKDRIETATNEDYTKFKMTFSTETNS